ncbi:MAG: DEAD/DEAH box helicase [Treponema sp.]|jgi:ATP-dependent Lhr-like helicase|nr:DEAD/DEAH box helicase [Treponema sp.]
MDPLPFHPLVAAWFHETYGKPTAVQAAAWPLIDSGRHVLALAPTGSGKTLTAFLSAISRFCQGSYDAGRVAVLYVSPLKALNEDIRRNLLEPLEALRARFEGAGESFPPITVETRSGDTPQADRRRFYRKPPSILVTTPESLGILLLNPRGREILSSLRCLILDEIHSVLGTKRGSYLSCQTDRLALAAGEFQRIGLSATLRPAEAAAEFLGGLEWNGDSPEPRPVSIAAPPSEKRISFAVEESSALPAAGGTDTADTADTAGAAEPRGSAAARILRRIEANRVTLVFVSSRRGAESLSYAVNRIAGRPLCRAHHGSLSKELRRAVEQALAEGQIPCVVATSSLELGIDIGAVDEVILAGAAASLTSSLQRIGRSGHGAGRTSRGRLIPMRAADLLSAAALALGIREREIEETRPLENPLDVLAQIILALVAERERRIDELYTLLRGFYVFRNLGRAVYGRVVEMLAGYGGGLRRRELKPRLYQEEGSLAAAPGTLALLYASGGVIPSRGLYALRLAGGKGKIGELDEEFVWERRIGDHFNLGNRSWRISAIGDEAVEVEPAAYDSGYAPFWRADPLFRSLPLSRRILEILDRFSARGELGAEDLPEFSAAALEDLNRYLDSQRKAQGGVPLPGAASVVCEIVRGGRGMCRVLLHSFRGGAINYPLSLAAAQELEDRCGGRVESFSDNDAILFLLPGPDERDPAEIRTLVTGALLALGRAGDPGRGLNCGLNPGYPGLNRGERQLRRRLESSSRFGAAFREAAERSLMLPKAGFGRRSPLWLTRQRSKRLFDAVMPDPGNGGEDFPLIAEAWRSCLRDEFDMDGFRSFAEALGSGALALSFFQSPAGSPFARGIIWQETNALLYQGDGRDDLRLRASRGPSLSDRVIAEALGDAALRPLIPAALAADFAARLRRELPGWAPEDPRSLAEWVKERIAIPADEWRRLAEALPEPLGEELRRDPGLGGRLRFLRRPGAALESAVHREREGAWLGGGPGEWLCQQLCQWLCQWLRFQGPVPLSRIGEVFGLGPAEIEGAVRALAAEGGEGPRLVYPVAVEGQGADLVCDAENLELLLRLRRAGARPEIAERPASLLVPFLALRQGFGAESGGIAGLGEWAAGLELPAGLWETEILAARLDAYRGEDLDRELREGRLLWYGAGAGRAGFCRPEDLDLVLETGAGADQDPGGAGPGGQAGLPGGPGFFDLPRSYWEIRDAAGPGGRALVGAVWEQAWKGRLSSDSWEALRQGGWDAPESADPAAPGEPPGPALSPFTHRRIPAATRAARARRNAPLPGRWFSLDREPCPQDPLYRDELDRDRVRLLLARWGVLCRTLRERESPALSGARLLPAIRRMELAGELVAGRFFAGISAPQFASPGILGELEEAEEFAGRDALYWINAADPASPAGLGMENPDPRLPARSPRNRLYYRGRELAAVSLRGGKEIRIFSPPERSPAELFKALRARKPDPGKKLVVETVNGQAAAESPYAPCFTGAGFIADRGKLYLW